MIHSNCMLLALGLLIFCFQDACSVGNYPTKCYYEPTIGWCFSPVLRYFFHHVRGHCMMFTYSGCMGNGNNFLTFEECVRECQSYGDTPEFCKLPIELGRCTSSIPRFYYNTANEDCEKFTFGGCGANQNNFANWYDCRATCQNSIHLPAKCKLHPQIGGCSTPTTRFFFDIITGTCMDFVFSGCGGNENNYLSEEECLKDCKRKVIPYPNS